jgi:hypothetical protein
MLVQIVKRADGGGVLRCTRDDGSVTWQKQGRHAPFFALHDLTHFAVEITLGFRRGFFGLMAEGWDVEDTTGKGQRGPLPEEAGQVERIVGLFDAERASGVIWTVEEFNEHATRKLTPEEIAKVKAKRSELFQRWFDLSPDETLELTYPVPVGTVANRRQVANPPTKTIKNPSKGNR